MSAESQLRTRELRRPESAVAEIADVDSCLELHSLSLEPRRKKWESQGGYPTLAHGGLTLLQVAVPWIEISKPSTAQSTNIFVIIIGVTYSIIYYSEAVQTAITSLPDTLAARYIVLTRRMRDCGPNLGEPHTKTFGNGLFELRLKGADGIARVFFCTQVGQRIVMLHGFVKKTNKTPVRERRLAEARMKEIHHADPR